MSSFVWTGAEGYYNRIGAIVALIENVQGIEAETAPSPSSNWGATGQNIHTEKKIVDDFNALFTSNELGSISSLDANFENWRDSSQNWFSQLRTMARSFTINQVHRERPLHALNESNALFILQQLMVEDAQTLNQNTLSTVFQTPPASNIGVLNFAVDYTTPLGVKANYAVTERLVATVTSGTAAAGSGGDEKVTVRGRANEATPFEWNYPTGTGVSTILTVQNASKNAVAAQNMMRNSSWVSWTDPLFPDNWAKTGADDLSQELTVFTRDSSAIRYTASGTDVSITQRFNVSSGTTQTLKLATKYGFSFMVRVLTGAPAAGSVEISLFDGTATIDNVNGDPQALATTLIGVTPDTWIPVSGFFETGRTIPAAAYLKIEFKGVTTAQVVFLDALAFTEVKPLYTGGETIIAFPDSDPLLNPQVLDYWEIDVTNDYAGRLLTWMGRLFNLQNVEYALPSSGSPTIDEGAVIP